MKCPRCGHARQPEADECPYCGIHYEYVEKKIANQSPPQPPPAEENDLTKAMPEKIITVCSTCGQKYRVSPEQIGVKTKCKKCGFDFTIMEVS